MHGAAVSAAVIRRHCKLIIDKVPGDVMCKTLTLNDNRNHGCSKRVPMIYVFIDSQSVSYHDPVRGCMWVKVVPVRIEDG